MADVESELEAECPDLRMPLNLVDDYEDHDYMY